MSAKLAKQQYLGILMEHLGNCDDDGVLYSSADDILRETADYLDIAIAEAQLEAVEEFQRLRQINPYFKKGYSRGQSMSTNPYTKKEPGITKPQHDYLVALRKAAGKGE